MGSDPLTILASAECLWICTLATSLSLRRPSSGATMSVLSRATLICALLLSSCPQLLPLNHPDHPSNLPRPEERVREAGESDVETNQGEESPTPVLPEANDRIHTLGYNYCPVHTEIYGSYRPRQSEHVSKQLRESLQKIRNNRQTVVIVNMIHCCQEYKLLTLPYITLVNKIDMLLK